MYKKAILIIAVGIIACLFWVWVKALPPQERQQAENQIINQIWTQATDFLGPYFQYLPPILAFGLFLILQGLSFIFVWLAVAVSIFLFWAMKKSGLVRIGIEQKEAETVEF